MLVRQPQLTFAPLHHRLRRLKLPTSRGDQCTKKEGYRHSLVGQTGASRNAPPQLTNVLRRRQKSPHLRHVEMDERRPLIGLVIQSKPGVSCHSSRRDDAQPTTQSSMQGFSMPNQPRRPSTSVNGGVSKETTSQRPATPPKAPPPAPKKK